MLLLVPSDPLNPRRSDEHFAPEAQAATELGWDVARIDHDSLTMGRVGDAVSRLGGRIGEAVYRGWMVRSEQYAAAAEALGERGVTLRTTPDLYRAAHELPGWYEHFAAHTAESVWTEGPDVDALVDRISGIGPGAAVLKDYVKSEKHYWTEAAYIPDVDDTDAVVKVARRFLELRDDAFVGGLVARNFEDYEGPEARTWWVNGRCVLVTPHPDEPDEAVPPVTPDQFADAVQQLGSPFVTVDLALRADGVWRVVEVGDGQVSDRPRTVDASDLVVNLD